MTQAVAENRSPATLRLYGWRPWAISLGYHQSETDVDLERCRAQGVDVVLRPTGGRAILHADEVTYAVAMPPSSPFFSNDIQSVYEVISRCLVASLELLGIPAEFDRAGKTPKDFARGELSTLCYASSVQYEIGIGSRKLVGSAQRRIQGSVLQHGSILLGDAHLAVTDYLAAKNNAWRERVKRYMSNNTISLNQQSPKVTYAALVGALETGFQRTLGIQFVHDQISDAEWQHARQLLKKFSILANVSHGD